MPANQLDSGNPFGPGWKRDLATKELKERKAKSNGRRARTLWPFAFTLI
jgi:hypothetical protein